MLLQMVLTAYVPVSVVQAFSAAEGHGNGAPSCWAKGVLGIWGRHTDSSSSDYNQCQVPSNG